MSQDEQLGYISAKVESLQSEINEFKETHKQHVVNEDEDRKEILKELKRINDNQQKLITEVTIYKRVFGILGAIVMALLTLNFGDVVRLVKGLI